MSLKLEILPQKAIVVRRQKDRRTLAAAWFGENVLRPYIWPFLGPHDREVVRIGHPLDPVGHSHHRGIFIAHADVGGVDFWSEKRGVGRIVQRSVTEVISAGETVSALCDMRWQRPSGAEIVKERRRMSFSDLGGGELALDLDIVLEASEKAVTLGKTDFGILGIRVARTMRVEEGLGGRIINSNEGENEAGCFGQHATWCDYSGPVPLAFDPEETQKLPPRSFDRGVPSAIVGIACFDHPDNSPRDTPWHARDDGWIGPGLTRDAARKLTPGKPVRARYRILSHADRASGARLGDRYLSWLRRITGTKKQRVPAVKRKKP